VDGFTILVGKSSTDNEKVTFRAGGPNDLWLHARDYPGSHVIILTEKRHVPDKVLYTAAALAAAGSGARNDNAPEIMVTERKWVRKLKGGKPGQVTVEKFRTIRPRGRSQI
jgi:predicted ribosome quality control (RQC) complex YloA/Tae2 family protein